MVRKRVKYSCVFSPPDTHTGISVGHKTNLVLIQRKPEQAEISNDAGNQQKGTKRVWDAAQRTLHSTPLHFGPLEIKSEKL